MIYEQCDNILDTPRKLFLEIFFPYSIFSQILKKVQSRGNETNIANSKMNSNDTMWKGHFNKITRIQYKVSKNGKFCNICIFIKLVKIFNGKCCKKYCSWNTKVLLARKLFNFIFLFIEHNCTTLHYFLISEKACFSNSLFFQFIVFQLILICFHIWRQRTSN